MLRTAFRRRGLALVTAATVATVLLISGGSPAAAQETDDEGGTKNLRELLDEAATAYQDAKVELEKSQQRQLKLTVRLASLEDELALLEEELQTLAVTAYRTGRLSPFASLLNAGSPNAFLERAATVELLAKREQRMLNDLRRVKEEIAQQQAELAAEIEVQEQEVAKLEAAKKKAEDALYAIGGGASSDFVPYESPPAKPAPRNPDGSWPAESCTEDDPTTGGCLTPRMLHALNEARIFGFDRYTACYRSGTWGEHPIGRACDFSTSWNGFGGAAVGADKDYGDRLASFFVANADALGVMYVIWYRQIWFPGTGWRWYGGAAGDPASDHTNHVHVSIR